MIPYTNKTIKPELAKIIDERINEKHQRRAELKRMLESGQIKYQNETNK